ncbi:MAG: 6,7-dimethyl-8-ribityllumazine synthase [Chloroflexi bacterium]|nr:6,7-dimethyl-8-ribityllumazine synthase [Chloroflexota bacterium]
MPQEISGGLDGAGLRVAVVAARFNNVITKNLMEGALGTLSEYGVRDGDISTAWVPGSFELPLAAKTFAESGRYDAVICLGAVIRGETSHYDMVCNQAASGIAAVGRETGIPTMFGVLTTENMEQAINRSGGKVGNLGSDCAVGAIQSARLVQAIKTG